MSHTLGRGLGSLIPSKNVKSELVDKEVAGLKQSIHFVSTESVEPNPQQPRQDFDREALEELINSIIIHGIIQPLVVQQVGDSYQLITGERRLRAAKLLGLKKVPAIMRTATEQEKLEIALVENVQRKNLNPIERADGYQRLADEFNLTQDQVAKKVGQSRAAVANSLRLLSLSPEIQEALRRGRLSEGHAKALLGIADEKERETVFREIISSKLSVRFAEAKARRRTGKKSFRRSQSDPNITEKEEALQEALGTKVEIRKQGGQGAITIHFYSPEELQEIVKKIIE